MQINFFKTIRSSQSQNACARIEGKGDQSALFQKIKRTRCTIIGFFQEPKKVATPVTWGRQLTAVIQSPEHQLATSNYRYLFQYRRQCLSLVLRLLNQQKQGK